jgi:predicted acyl esterase
LLSSVINSNISANLYRQACALFVSVSAVTCQQLRITFEGGRVARANWIKRFAYIFVFIAPLLAFQPVTESQTLNGFRERYTKYEYLIPMRDGVRLFTNIYAPKDTSQKYPFLLSGYTVQVSRVRL